MEKELNRLRTLSLKGGQVLTFQPSGNPRVDHNGVDSVCHLVLTDSEVLELTEVLGRQNIRVYELEYPVKEKEEPKIDPPPACYTCFWLDVDGNCGLSMWDPETKNAAREHPLAITHEQNCWKNG